MSRHDELSELLQHPTALSGRLRETIDDIRAIGCGPVPIPNDALRLFLAEQSSAVQNLAVPLPRAAEPTRVRIVPVVTGEPVELAERSGRRRLPPVGVATRFASLGLVAKLGLGTAVAAASFTAAAAADVLPPPVQRVVERVVEAMMPFDAVSRPERGPAVPARGVGDTQPERPPAGVVAPSDDAVDRPAARTPRSFAGPGDPVAEAIWPGDRTGSSSGAATSTGAAPRPYGGGYGTVNSGPSGSRSYVDGTASPSPSAPVTNSSASPGTFSGGSTGAPSVATGWGSATGLSPSPAPTWVSSTEIPGVVGSPSPTPTTAPAPSRLTGW